MSESMMNLYLQMKPSGCRDSIQYEVDLSWVAPAGRDNSLDVISLGAREITLVAFSVSRHLQFSCRFDVFHPSLLPRVGAPHRLPLHSQVPPFLLGTHLQALLFRHQPCLSLGRSRFLLALISEDPLLWDIPAHPLPPSKCKKFHWDPQQKAGKSQVQRLAC